MENQRPKQNNHRSVVDSAEGPNSIDEMVHSHFEGKMTDASTMVSRLANEIVILRRERDELRGELDHTKKSLHAEVDHTREQLHAEVAHHVADAEAARAALQTVEDTAREKEREWEKADRALRRNYEQKEHRAQMEFSRRMGEKEGQVAELTRELELTKSRLNNAEDEMEKNKNALVAYQMDVEKRLKTMENKKLEDRDGLNERVQLRGRLSTLQGEVDTMRLELSDERAKSHALEVQTRRLLDDHKALASQRELEKTIADLQRDKDFLLKDKESMIRDMDTLRNERDRFEKSQQLLLTREGLLVGRLEHSKKSNGELEALKARLKELATLGKSYKEKYLVEAEKAKRLTTVNNEVLKELKYAHDLMEEMQRENDERDQTA